ncbi:MAG TPA: PilN domain-containing protein [Thermoanaerobaculia bacterium]|nr:PilN domain-containing protein [Thermoanaerobaculia bacterium]
MIKINLVREGRAVRGATGAPAAVPGVAATAGPGNLNNILIIGLLVIGTVASLGYWLYAKRNLANTQATMEQRKLEAQKLQSAINAVNDFQKKKDSLQKRIDLINQLKQNQKGPVRIMDQVSRDLPDLVWLDTMNIASGRIALNGRGLNPNAIALFVANVKQDPFFEEPQVGTITQVSLNPPVYTFDMNFAFSYAPKTTGQPGVAPIDAMAPAATMGTAGTATATASPGKPGGAKR